MYIHRVSGWAGRSQFSILERQAVAELSGSAELIVIKTGIICYHPRDDFGMKKGVILRMMPLFADILNYSIAT